MSISTSLRLAPDTFLPSVPQPHHLVWLTRDLEKPFYAEVAPSFDAVIVTSNLLEKSFESVQAFLLSAEKPFLIHPQLHRFQHSGFFETPAGALRPNLSRLAEAYGAETDLPLGQTPIRGEMLVGGKAKRLVRNVLEYQRDRLVAEIAPLFLELERIDLGALRPAALVGPTLFVRTLDQDYEAAALLARLSAEESSGTALLEIRLDARILVHEAVVERVLADYSPLPTPAFLIGLCQFNTDELKDPRLQSGLIRVVSSLAASGRRVYVLYGGFTGLLLRWAGATGFAHGLAPTEPDGRAEPAAGQPRPPLTHYAGGLHRAVSFDLMARAVDGMDASDYYRDLCDCQVCRKVLLGDMSRFASFIETEVKVGQRRRQPTSLAERLNHFHFLLAKQSEARRLSLDTPAETAARLRQQGDRLASKLQVAPLRVWTEFVQRMVVGQQSELTLTVNSAVHQNP